MKKQFIQLLFALGLLSTLGACKDFQEINKDPNVVDEASVKIDYLLNSSIIETQQDPHIAERMFVLYWDRVSGYEANGGLSTFSFDNGWTSDYWSIGYLHGWLKNATLAVTIGEKRIADPTFPELEKPRLKNIVQMARIWRAYLYSEASDNFGPVTISKYDGTIPTEMSKTSDVYKFILTELKEAVAAIDLTAKLNTDEKRNDLFYEGDLSSWQRYANSMRMRFAMRIGDQAEFEAAAADPAGYIGSNAEIASILEKGSWDPTSAVMSRAWNTQPLSLTFANLTVGLGGVDIMGVENIQHSAIKGITAEQQTYIKDPYQYLGLKMENYLAPSTNAPNVQYFMDYIPNYSDPRLYLLFCLPGINNEYANHFPQTVDAKKGVDETISKIYLADQGTSVPKLFKKGDGAIPDTVLFRAQCNLAVFPYGSSKDYGSNFVSFTGEVRNRPTKSSKWRNLNNDNGNERIFFGPWESNFLIAEAALKGWATPISAQVAYETGVQLSFAWHGIDALASAYLQSEDYNRVGTSASFTHTAEPAPATLDYVDFQSNLEVVATNNTVKTYKLKTNPTKAQMTYTYPKGRYATSNDELTKIITQKYLANSPYLPLEAWSDYRRLNLPFMENPVIEDGLANMPWYTKAKSGQFNWVNIPQRLPYPTGLAVSNPAVWSSALQQLGGPNGVGTPLTWAVAK